MGITCMCQSTDKVLYYTGKNALWYKRLNTVSSSTNDGDPLSKVIGLIAHMLFLCGITCMLCDYHMKITCMPHGHHMADGYHMPMSFKLKTSSNTPGQIEEMPLENLP